MTLKYKILISVIALAAAFAFGRYSNQQPEVKTAETKKLDDTKQVVKEDRTQTTIVTTKSPDGTIKTTTTVKNNVETTTKDVKETTDSKQTDTIPPKTNTLNVSALIAIDVKNPLIPVYGVSVTKQVLGPITAGAFGLTSGLVGVSIGLNF